MTTMTEGMRVADVIGTLRHKGYSQQARTAALEEVLQLDRDNEWTCDDGSTLPYARGLTLPQDGRGWLLTEDEAARILETAETIQPVCETCGQPRRDDTA